jgi:hypothetical protein
MGLGLVSVVEGDAAVEVEDTLGAEEAEDIQGVEGVGAAPADVEEAAVVEEVAVAAVAVVVKELGSGAGVSGGVQVLLFVNFHFLGVIFVLT